MRTSLVRVLGFLNQGSHTVGMSYLYKPVWLAKLPGLICAIQVEKRCKTVTCHMSSGSAYSEAIQHVSACQSKHIRDQIGQKRGALSRSGCPWAPETDPKIVWEKYKVFRLQSVWCGGATPCRSSQVFQGQSPVCPTQSKVWFSVRGTGAL